MTLLNIISLMLICLIVIVHIIYFPEIKKMRRDMASLKNYFEAEGDPLDGEE